jgi:heavy metal sensor kinase
MIVSQMMVVGGFACLSYLSWDRFLYRQLDQELDDDIETAEARLERGPGGALRWMSRDRHDEPDPERLVEVFDEEGRPLYRSPTSLSIDLGPAPRVPEHMRDGARSHSFGDVHVRVLSGGCTVGGTPVVIRATRSDRPQRRQLATAAAAMTFGLVGMVLLATLSGYGLARHALRPVGKMAERATTITAESLSERLPVEDPADELGRLATVFNATLDRLERSFEQLRRFTADASHELRTPLTALKSVGEVALRSGADLEASREVIGSMLEEADRLARLVDSLLTLSRADAGRVKLTPEPTDLGALAREVTGHLGVLAEEKHQALSVEANGETPVRVDPLVLRQAVINLVDNAIKYCPNGKAIRIVVGSRGGDATLEVQDEGPGIAPEHRERVFDRFYRIDTSRSRELGGTGLGLAISKWAVEANGGKLELESEVGKGSRFRIVLPRLASPAKAAT